MVDVGYGGVIPSEWGGWHWIEGRDRFVVIEPHHALLERMLASAAA